MSNSIFGLVIMEQHAIPQQISSYQFRLVGDMTLKQFFQLAGGALIGLLFYASPLPPIVKWPFIVFFGLLGVALAFLPFEERPLEVWVVSFLKAVYLPTIFEWKKSSSEIKYFQDETNNLPGVETSQPSTLPTTSFSKLDIAEGNFLSSLGKIFSLPSVTPTNIISTPTQSTPTPKVPMGIPTNIPVSFAKPSYVTVEEKPVAPTTPASTFSTSGVAPTIAASDTGISQAAQFSVEAAPPYSPTIPNTVTGQILDHEGKIVSGAIMEIRDAMNRPVRALKSNMLGHFMIVTPLMPGKYQILTEKEGLDFIPVSFEANNIIIPPIAIRAKGLSKTYATEELIPEPIAATVPTQI